MDNNRKKLINKKSIFFTISVIVFAVLIYKINKAFLSADDIVYKNAFNSISTFFTWTKEFFFAWSGRIPILALTNIFTHLPIQVFKIANTLVTLLIVFGICTIVNIIKDDLDPTIKRKLMYVVFCLIFFVNVAVLSGGAIWLCGALNYLWTFAFMLISIIPFIAQLKNKEFKQMYYILFILSNFISCFSEQSGAILIAFATITIIYCLYKKIKLNKILILHYIVIMIITLISLKAPGNEARFYSEQTQWYPSFAMLSMGDKILQGYLNLANHLINDTTLLCFIITTISSYLIIKNKKIKEINKIISIIPVIYFGLRLIPFDAYTIKINEYLFTFNRFDFVNIYSHTANINIVISIIILLITVAELIYVFRDKKNGIITAILYCAGLCSAMALSFSPTIYASGNRIFFATDFLLILVARILISEFFEKLKAHNKQMRFLIPLCIFAGILYLNLYLNCLTTIIW